MGHRRVTPPSRNITNLAWATAAQGTLARSLRSWPRAAWATYAGPCGATEVCRVAPVGLLRTFGLGFEAVLFCESRELCLKRPVLVVNLLVLDVAP